MQKEKSIKFKFPISEWKALHDHLIDAYEFISKASRHIDDMVTILCLDKIMLRFEKKFLDWEYQGLKDHNEKLLTFNWVDYIALIKANCIDGDPYAQNVMDKLVLGMPPEIANLLK